MLYLINSKKYLNKSVNQLWDEDRKSFYFWIIGLFVGLIVLFSINFASLIIYAKDKDLIIKNFEKYLIDNNISVVNIQNSAYNYWASKLVQCVINIGFLLITIYSLSSSLVKSFKIKSFASISILPTLFIFINTIYGFFALFQLLIFKVNITDEFNLSVANVIIFSLNFVYLFVWFLFSRNVSLIRRIFWRSQIIDSSNGFQLQHDEFGNPVFKEQMKKATTPESIMKESEMYKRLDALSKKQLDTIAVQLSISGYEAMSKEELVKLIYLIHNSNNSETKEEIVETETKDDKKDDIDKK